MLAATGEVASVVSACLALCAAVIQAGLFVDLFSSVSCLSLPFLCVDFCVFSYKCIHSLVGRFAWGMVRPSLVQWNPS